MQMDVTVSSQSRLREFVGWAEGHGINVTNGLRPAQIFGQGLGVLTERALKVGA